MELTSSGVQHPWGIEKVQADSIMLQNEWYSFPLFLNEKGPRSWTLSRSSSPDTADLSVLLETNPDLILLGTTRLSLEQTKAWQAICWQQRVGFEQMTVEAAARTFNLLLLEGRRVLAAFF